MSLLFRPAPYLMAVLLGIAFFAATSGQASSATTGDEEGPTVLPFRGTYSNAVNCTNSNCGGYHSYWAIDFSVGRGTAVYAAGPGIVYRAEDHCENRENESNGPIRPETDDAGNYVWDDAAECGSGNYGNHVILKHDDGSYSYYAHLRDNLEVSVDDTVDIDSVIGYVGNSGRSDGFHLHYEERTATADGQPSAERRDPGPMHACHGEESVNYPSAAAVAGWKNARWITIRSDSTSCLASDLEEVDEVADGCSSGLPGTSLVSHDQTLNVFGRGINHEFYGKSWSDGAWRGLVRVQPGSVFESPAVAVSCGSALVLFGRGIDDEIYENRLTSTGWSGFTRIHPNAVYAGGPVALTHDDSIYVFGHGINQEYYLKAWNGSGWSGLSRFAPGAIFAGEPSVVSFDDELYVYGRGIDDEIYENRLTSTGWSGFTRIHPGAVFEADPVVVQFAGGLHLVARGIDQEHYKLTRTSLGWTGFERLHPGAVFEG